MVSKSGCTEQFLIKRFLLAFLLSCDCNVVGNDQDFYNLVDVYLDAVFYPRCVNEVQTFQQEGWHYELNNPSEDITFKGKLIGQPVPTGSANISWHSLVLSIPRLVAGNDKAYW